MTLGISPNHSISGHRSGKLMAIALEAKGDVRGEVKEAEEALGILGVEYGFFNRCRCKKQTGRLGGVVAFIIFFPKRICEGPGGESVFERGVFISAAANKDEIFGSRRAQVFGGGGEV